jgi:hypothetical protein
MYYHCIHLERRRNGNSVKGSGRGMLKNAVPTFILIIVEITRTFTKQNLFQGIATTTSKSKPLWIIFLHLPQLKSAGKEE